MDDFDKKLKESLEKKGFTKEFELNKVEEFIKAIETGAYKPKNKKHELKKLKEAREVLLKIIDDNKTT